MNETALKAAFNSINFGVKFYNAMKACARTGFAQHVTNSKNVPIIRVEYERGSRKIRGVEYGYGFIYTYKNGRVFPRDLINKFLRENI